MRRNAGICSCWLLTVTIGVLLVSPVRRAVAQPAPPAADAAPTIAAPPILTAADVEAIKARLQGPDAATLNEEQAKQAATLAQQALDDLAAAEKLRADAETYAKLKQNLPTERDALAAKLVSVASSEDLKPDPEASLATLETELLERRQQLTQETARFDEWVASVQARPARREVLRNQLFSQPQQLTAAQAQLTASPPAGEPPLLTEAAQAAARARKLRLERLPEAANAELSYYDALDALDVPRLRREELERSVARRKREVTAWENAVQATRQDAIARRIDAATAAADKAPAPVSELFDENLALAREERTIRSKVTEVRSEQEEAATSLEDLQKRFKQLEERERNAAGSAALGLRLRQQRELLVDPENLRHTVARRLDTVEEARLTALDKSDELDKLGNLEPVVEEYVQEHPAPLAVSDRSWEEQVTAAFQQRKEFLAELVKAYDAYTDALDDLERDQESLANLSEKVMNFIEERVLWIRSHREVTVNGVIEEVPVLTWLGRGSWIQEPLRVLRADAWHRPGWYLLFVFSVAVLQLRRRRQRRRLDELARHVGSRSNLEIAPTLQALAVTLMLCVLWPGIVTFFGYRLIVSSEATQFTRSLGHNLYAIAAIVALVELTRHIVRVDGLGDAHFDWGERVRSRLLSWVRWLCVCGLPVLLLIAVLNARTSDAGGDFLERIAFSCVLVLLAWALRDLVHPRNGVLVEWTSRHPGSWIDRLRPVWSLAVLLVPIVLAALTLYGYYYTAQQLAEKLVLTLVLFEAAVVVRGVLTRWLMLRHRRLAIEQARARRAALAETPTTTTEESVARVLEVTEQKPDLSASSTQSQRLIGTSLVVLVAAAIWFVWADVLPALNYFNSAPVWHTYETITQTSVPGTTSPIPGVASSNGSEASSEDATSTLRVRIQSVTWADLIRAVVVLILTFTAARNVPGLLEITILERLPIDASVRYAVQAFARYAIVLLGMVVISNLLGLEWSKIQWLAAALTFGLAFGLQEIFANFVSGLIILSEQPVRVGDVVTIDNVSGVVSRIRMRSTTITDWDRKEYIVPNKEFITGRLLNWTLTDSMNRIVIPVGVSYASDPEHVQRVLLDIAESHANVLEDPPPVVTFDSFGDSALNFTLRVYLPSLERRLQTIHELHTQICLRFRAERIEIPFPQRDLNLRAIPDSLADALPVERPAPRERRAV